VPVMNPLCVGPNSRLSKLWAVSLAIKSGRPVASGDTYFIYYAI